MLERLQREMERPKVFNQLLEQFKNEYETKPHMVTEWYEFLKKHFPEYKIDEALQEKGILMA